MEDDRSLRWVPVNTGCVGPTQSAQTDTVNLQRLCLLRLAMKVPY